MSINYVNTGTSPNKGNGDTLRTAFNKINANFSFLNTVTSADISSIKGDILPNLDVTYSLGSLTKHWKSLYVNTATFNTVYANSASINSIVISGFPLTIDTASNTIVIGSITSSTTSTSLATQSYVIEQILANPGTIGPVGPQGPAVSTGLLVFDASVGIVGGNNLDPAYPYNLIQLIPNNGVYDINNPVFGGSFQQSGQFLNIYPDTANALDPRIHIAAGIGGDLAIGTTQTNVLVNHLGNISITSINPTTGTHHTWNFGVDGSLILPIGGTITDSSGTNILASYVFGTPWAQAGYLTSSTVNQYVVHATTSTLVNGTYTIALNTIGELVFPDGTIQTTASTGTQTVNLAVLKAVVAASVSFADFQTLIANL
jgi:hypothetical protein